MTKEKGFTLIELLVVIAIIGILAAIAIPQFAEYKTRAFNSRAQSDLRNGLTAQEAYFVDNESYLACNSAATCTGSSGLPGFVISENVFVAFGVNTAADEFSGASCHSRGDKLFQWMSNGTATYSNKIEASTAASCSAAPTAPTVS